MLLAWLAGCGPPPEDPEDRQMLHTIRDPVRAVHFCIAATGSVDPRIFTDAVARQLTRTLPGFGDALLATTPERVVINVDIKVKEVSGNVTGTHIEQLNLHGMSGEKSFNEIIRTPLGQLYEHQDPGPTLILIDALDEAATFTGKYHLPKLLFGLRDLPPQVRVLATTRPNTLVKAHLSHAYEHALDLIDDAPDSEQDVRSYVYHRMAALDDGERNEVADQIAQASEGVFLYAHLMVEESVSCDGPVVQHDRTLPSGLRGLYQRSLLREVEAGGPLWHHHYRPVLGTLALAQGDGLTRQQLVDILGWDVQVDQVLQGCAPYLIGDLPEGPFRPFHQSFVDFLLDRETPFWVDAIRVHRAIAHHTWEMCQGDWMGCDDYGLRHGLLHMALSKDWDTLAQLLANVAFLEAQAHHLGLYEMLLGLSTVVARLTLPESDLDRPRFRERRACRGQAKRLLRVLDREAHNLRDWDPQRWPAYFAQQIHNRAVYEGFPDVMATGRDRLAHLTEPHFLLNWRTEHEPAALLRSLDVPQFYAMALAHLPDNRLLSGGTDRVLRIWHEETGALLTTLPEHHPQSIRALAATSDGRHALSASFDDTLGVWDLETGCLVNELEGHAAGLRAVQVTPDDRHAVSAGNDGTLRVWDLEAARDGRTVCPLVLQGHKSAVWDVAVNAQGDRVASVGNDGHILLWDLQDGDDPIARYDLGGTPLRAVTFLPGQNQVLVGDKAGCLIWLDLDTGGRLAQSREHHSSIFSIIVTHDGSRALTASWDRSVKVWDVEEGALKLTQSLSGHSGHVYDVVLSADGQEAISAADDGMLKVWQLTTRLTTPKMVHHPKGHQGTVRSLALAPDAASPLLAVSSAQDGSLKVWDVDGGRPLHEYRPKDDPLDRSTHARHYEAVELLDHDTIVASALDLALVLRRLADGRAVRTLRRSASAGELTSNEVRDLAVSPDRRRVASAASDGRLSIWDLETGEAMRTPEAHGDLVRVVTFGPDGGHLLSGGDDGALKIWDAHTAALCATFPSPDAGPIRGIALLPQGQVVAGYEHGLLVIWDRVKRHEVRRIEVPGEWIRGVVVTAGGREVMVADNRRTIRVWETGALGEGHSTPVALVRLESAARSLALSRGASTLLVGDVVGGVSCLHYVEGGKSTEK
jgi:WD40 repeat protein